MKVKCAARKRIWEVDCLSLDAALAASFEWRELINMLESHGHRFDLRRPDSLLELRAQDLIHSYCHSENAVSLRVERLLNEFHAKTLQAVSFWDPLEAGEYFLTSSLENKEGYGGLFWALGSEKREGFDCIRRRFHQRFQIYSIRKLVA